MLGGVIVAWVRHIPAPKPASRLKGLDLYPRYDAKIAASALQGTKKVAMVSAACIDDLARSKHHFDVQDIVGYPSNFGREE